MSVAAWLDVEGVLPSDGQVRMPRHPVVRRIGVALVDLGAIDFARAERFGHRHRPDAGRRHGRRETKAIVGKIDRTKSESILLLHVDSYSENDSARDFYSRFEPHIFSETLSRLQGLWFRVL